MLSCDVVVLERGLLAETMSVGANFCGIAGFGAKLRSFRRLAELCIRNGRPRERKDRDEEEEEESAFH